MDWVVLELILLDGYWEFWIGLDWMECVLDLALVIFPIPVVSMSNVCMYRNDAMHIDFLLHHLLSIYSTLLLYILYILLYCILYIVYTD